MTIAKAIFGSVGAAVVGIVLTAIMMPEWIGFNLENHTAQTVVGFFISVAFGGSVVFMIYSAASSKKIADKDSEISRLESELSSFRENGTQTARREARTLDGKITVGIDGLAAFTSGMARAALDAAENGTVSIEEHEKAVRKSIENKDGVFDYVGRYFGGARTGSDESRYRLTRDWHLFLSDRAMRERLREISNR